MCSTNYTHDNPNNTKKGGPPSGDKLRVRESVARAVRRRAAPDRTYHTILYYTILD